MPDLQYVEGYQGTLKVGSVEYSVEAWSARFGSNQQKITASKNSGWAVHRRGFKEMTGDATIIFESDVDTLTGTGPIPGATVTLELIVSATEKYSGSFNIGDATGTWDPNGVFKLAITFGNTGAITTLPG